MFSQLIDFSGNGFILCDRNVVPIVKRKVNRAKSSQRTRKERDADATSLGDSVIDRSLCAVDCRCSFSTSFLPIIL